MSRHDAFGRLKGEVRDQLAAARAARERAELESMIAVLVVAVVVAACCVAVALLV